LSDWREAFVISGSYGMGDPLARSSTMGQASDSKVPPEAALASMKLIPLSERTGNSGGGRLARLDFLAGFTRL
jgi:hypothetical protein